jgi:hypothetical protein
MQVNLLLRSFLTKIDRCAVKHPQLNKIVK